MVLFCISAYLFPHRKQENIPTMPSRTLYTPATSPITELAAFPPEYTPRYCQLCGSLIPIGVTKAGNLQQYYNYNRVLFCGTLCRGTSKSLKLSGAARNSSTVRGMKGVGTFKMLEPAEIWLSKKLGSERPKKLHRIKGATCYE